MITNLQRGVGSLQTAHEYTSNPRNSILSWGDDISFYICCPIALPVSYVHASFVGTWNLWPGLISWGYPPLQICSWLIKQPTCEAWLDSFAQGKSESPAKSSLSQKVGYTRGGRDSILIKRWALPPAVSCMLSGQLDRHPRMWSMTLYRYKLDNNIWIASCLRFGEVAWEL